MQRFTSMAPAARGRTAPADLPASGVEVMIAGWLPGGGLDSHTLRVLIRDGGVRLGEAVRLVDRIVAGEDVTVVLPFDDRTAAVQALKALGASAAASDAAEQTA